MKTAVLLVGCALSTANALSLGAKAPPTTNATAVNSSATENTDDEIAALTAQIADVENEATTFKKTANITEVEEPVSFVHHCKPEVKAALDKAGPEAELPKKDAKASQATMNGIDGVFAESMRATERKHMIENEEFLLGLLMMHQTRKDWTREQEMDAICSMANDSPLTYKLYKHHNASQPLSMQFALLMDEEKKTAAPTLAPPLDLDGGVNSLGMKEGGAGGGAMAIIAKLMGSLPKKKHA